MYRLLAIAKYEDRYVIPTAALADADALEESHPLDPHDQCPVGSGPNEPVPLNLPTLRRPA